MELIMIAVKDNAVQVYRDVHIVRARGEAIRNFSDAVNNPNNQQLNQHPEDFDLYVLGTYDDNTGRVRQHEQQPELLIRGMDVRREQGKNT